MKGHLSERAEGSLLQFRFVLLDCEEGLKNHCFAPELVLWEGSSGSVAEDLKSRRWDWGYNWQRSSSHISQERVLLFCVVHTFLFSSVLRGDQGVVYLSHSIILIFYFFKILFICDLVGPSWLRAFSSCGKQGLLFIAVHVLLIEVASLVAEHGL